MLIRATQSYDFPTGAQTQSDLIKLWGGQRSNGVMTGTLMHPGTRCLYYKYVDQAIPLRHARYHTGRVFSVYGSSSSEIHKFQAGCWPAIAWRRIHSSRRSPIETLRKWRWQTTELQNRGDTKSHRCGAGTIYCLATKRSGKYIAFNPNCGVLEYVGSSMHYLTYLPGHPIRHITYL